MMKKIRWDEVATEVVTPSMQRKIIAGEKTMIARMSFRDGFSVPLHSHESEQITHCLSGTMRFWFGENKEEMVELHADDLIVIPSNLPHAALMVGDVEEIDTWAPPRQDWLDGTDDYLRNG